MIVCYEIISDTDSVLKNLINTILTNVTSAVLKSSDDKKVACEKNNYLIYTILLAIMCWLLLVVIYISCGYYYTRHWIKKEYALPYQYRVNSVEEINVKNQTYYFFDDMINMKNLNPNKKHNRWKVIQKYSYLPHWTCDGQRP